MTYEQAMQWLKDHAVDCVVLSADHIHSGMLSKYDGVNFVYNDANYNGLKPSSVIIDEFSKKKCKFMNKKGE